MMRKAFVLDPVMRSSAIKYDPCVSEDGRTTKCEDCKITLIADRFLGKEFQQEVLGKMGKARGRYPYVIIADALGCNLRCWFCYAYKFFDRKTAEENKCSIAYVFPERLAEQFGCKLEKLSDFEGLIKSAKSKNIKSRDAAVKHLLMKLPLMRIRISGGEPLFSAKETLLNPNSSNLKEATISYWSAFFEELDTIVGRLKDEGKLHIIEKEDVKSKGWKGDLPFPTCLAERSGRLNIRYDTNGILFGAKETADAFIGELFKLFKEGKLNNLFIEIDYSFKGATPTEYSWSQRRDLPVDPSKISFDYDNERHPQLRGYFNIIRSIERYCSEDGSFHDCIGITVERGINHNKSAGVCLNCSGSLSWEKFSEKTGIRFSIVDNPIEAFNWRNNRPKSHLIKNGASIKIISGEETFDLKDRPDMDAFDDFRRSHRDCSFVIYPVGDEIRLERPTLKIPKLDSYQTKLKEIPATGWILSGNPDNWVKALEAKKWGVELKHRDLWEKIKPNDIVFFYATRPVSKIIGYAKAKKLAEEDVPIWPDEIAENRAKYLLKIYLDEVNCLPEKEWTRGIKPFGLEIRHGINPVHGGDKVRKLINNLDYFVEK